jgi:hypothetical protein
VAGQHCMKMQAEPLAMGSRNANTMPPTPW